MGGHPGSISDRVPEHTDAASFARQKKDAERLARERAAERRASRTTIGDGGTLVVEGTLSVTGDLEVPAGSLSSPGGNMVAGVDVIAGRDVTAARDVTAGRDVAAVGQVRGDNGLFPNGLNSFDVYSRLVTGSGSFRTTSTNILGQMGQTVSSAQFKQDIVTAEISVETLRALRLVFFRYIANVPFDQAQQPLLLGLLAEEVHALGLNWLVIYDDDEQPFALVDFALPFLGLLLAQYAYNELDEVRAEVSELRAVVEALTKP